MRVPNTVGWGLGLALATALISGFSVFLNGQFVKLFELRANRDYGRVRLSDRLPWPAVSRRSS